MKIDYFCFSIPSLYQNDYILNKKDDENDIWIKNKEKELMDSARENNILIVFDRTTKKFYMNNKEFDVKGKVIFPRSFILYEEELLTKLEENGAISIQTMKDIENIENWPQKIQPIYRKVIETTYKDFKLNNEYYKSLFKNIFFKTAKKTNTHCTLKSFGFIDICGEKIFFTEPTLWDVSSNDNIFLSETFESIIDIENDMDCKEYRAFVINNNLLSISRSYIDYPTEIPNEVKTFIKEQIEKTSSINDFPNSYVLDVGQMIIDNKEVIDIIEYNQITSSGLEVCNLLVDNLINYNKSKRKEKILIKKN